MCVFGGGGGIKLLYICTIMGTSAVPKDGMVPGTYLYCRTLFLILMRLLLSVPICMSKRMYLPCCCRLLQFFRRRILLLYLFTDSAVLSVLCKKV